MSSTVVTELDDELLTTISFQIDAKKYTNAMKMIQSIRKKGKFRNSITLFSLEVRLLAHLSSKDNQDQILKIVERCIALMPFSQDLLKLEVLNNICFVLDNCYSMFEKSSKVYELEYEKYARLNSTKKLTEEFLNLLFFSYVRCFNFKKQQKIAQVLDKRFKKKKYSMFWGISMVLQEDVTELLKTKSFESEKDLPFLHKFANRIFEKNLYQVKFADPEIIIFYIKYLNSLGFFDKSIRVLREKVSVFFDKLTIDGRKYHLAKTYMKNKQFREAKILWCWMLENVDCEQWKWWKYLLTTNEELSKDKESTDEDPAIKMNIERKIRYTKEKEDLDDDKFHGHNRLVESVSDATYEITSKFVQKQNENNILLFIRHIQKRNSELKKVRRTPYLIEIEYLWKEDQLANTKKNSAVVFEFCVSYFSKFGGKKVCFFDLFKYFKYYSYGQEELKRLSDVLFDKERTNNESKKLAELRKQMIESKGKEKLQRKKRQQLKKNKDKKPLPDKMNPDEQKYIKFFSSVVNFEINFYKIKFLLNLVEETELKSLYKSYANSCSNYGKFIRKDTYDQVGDDYLVIVVLRIVQIFEKTRESKHIVEAIMLLETGLRKSKYNYSFKLLLIRMYCLIGMFSKAMDVYSSFDIKHIQIMSLSYLMYYDVQFFSSKTKLRDFIERRISPFLRNRKEGRKGEYFRQASGLIIKGFEKQAWSRVMESIQFIDSIKNDYLFHSHEIDLDYHFVLELGTPLGRVARNLLKRIPSGTKYFFGNEDYEPLPFLGKRFDSLLPLEIKYNGKDSLIRETSLNLRKCFLRMLFLISPKKKERKEKMIKEDVLPQLEILKGVEKEKTFIYEINELVLRCFENSEKNENEKLVMHKAIQTFFHSLMTVLKQNQSFVDVLRVFLYPLSYFLLYGLKVIFLKCIYLKEVETVAVLKTCLKKLRNLMNNVSRKKLFVFSKEELIKKKKKKVVELRVLGTELSEVQIENWRDVIRNNFKIMIEKIGNVLFELK